MTTEEFKNPAVMAKIVSLFSLATRSDGLLAKNIALELGKILKTAKEAVVEGAAGEPHKGDLAVVGIGAIFGRAIAGEELTPEHLLEIDGIVEAVKVESASVPVVAGMGD